MKKVLLVTLLSLASAMALADGVMKPMHNGIMAEATSGTRAEFSSEGNMIMVYLTSHHDEKLATKGASGEVTLLTGKDKQVLKLQPSGENSFMAQGQYKLAPGAKALVKVTLPGKATEQFRFDLK
ncbi:hypothetical protein [Chitinilyticum litopenaei]|uniref:hypothetical protein n=1 Tax=Chitinilyticum litopenaei TaxID=1121276 RepID=UPI00040F8A5F|nr:hypothetical protein [Chitinilyticum litopenaei]